MGRACVEALDSAKGDDMWLGSGVILGAAAKYIDVRQCKGADDLAQKRRFLVVRFDQGEMEVRRPDLDGQAGEARRRSRGR